MLLWFTNRYIGPQFTLEQKTRNVFVVLMACVWAFMVFDVLLTFVLEGPTHEQFFRKGTALFVSVMLPAALYNAHREDVISETTVSYMIHVCAMANNINALVVVPTRPMDQYAILLFVCLAVMNLKSWKWQSVSILPGLLIMTYNCTFGINGYELLQIVTPDSGLLVEIIVHARLIVFLPLVILVVNAHSRAYHTSLRSLECTVQMVKEVSEHMAEYNTDKAFITLTHYREEAESCDKKLLEVMSVIVSNLKKYKPHLPNYVVGGTYGEGDEDSPNQEISDGDMMNERNNDHSSDETSPRLLSGVVIPFETLVVPTPQPNTTNLTSLKLLATIPVAREISYALIKFNSKMDEDLLLVDHPQASRMFVDRVYHYANRSNAAVHTFIADTVHMTWNAASPIKFPKRFSVKTMKSIVAAPNRADVHGCVMTGSAQFRMTGTSHQAFLLHIDWNESLFELSKYAQDVKTNVVCGCTAAEITDPTLFVDMFTINSSVTEVHELTTVAIQKLYSSALQQARTAYRDGYVRRAISVIESVQRPPHQEYPPGVAKLLLSLQNLASKS
eukprot:PhF_6_TR20528/c0_g2_i1/m.29622